MFKQVTSHLTISARVWAVIAVTGICVVALSGYSFRILKQRTSEEREAKLRAAVEIAYSEVEHFGKLAESGAMTKEEAQRAAMEAVRPLRFEGGNYFFIYDRNVVLLMHPNPDLQGKSQAHLVDPNGKNYTVEFVRTAERSSEGTVDYLWPRPGSKVPVRKISYVKLYPAWSWIICAGLYLDDLDETMAQEARRILLATGLLGLLLVAAGVVVARSMRQAVGSVCGEADRLRRAVDEGALSERAEAAAVGSEFRPIIEAMNQTMDLFEAPIRTSAECAALIARGELPPPIRAEYRGEFRDLKDSLNSLIDTVSRRAQDIDRLIAAALDGKFDVRVDPSSYEGGNAKVIVGMNQLLDAVAAPIAEAAQVLDELAHRDLRARMSGEYRGEFARLQEKLNTTAQTLHDALAQVAKAAEQASSSAALIASSSQEVASGASEQASSLEETGSSLESLSSMTKRAADNAAQASGLAIGANRAATEGASAMEQMTTAMGKIKASAEGTSQIIKDINEIAFQTNLLALNAAVEAARAGEAGRGFAVVAEEVRSLALRSKEAANKTEELIRQSVKEAVEGEVTAGHVNGKLTEIVASVSKVTDIVAEISSAAKEQASGIEGVNRAMSEMNAVTQRNAASSEASSSAASELSSQSEQLAALAGVFQLDGVESIRETNVASTAPQKQAAPSRGLRPRRGGDAKTRTSATSLGGRATGYQLKP
jgi:methyl-accepting chemotaxis protein